MKQSTSPFLQNPSPWLEQRDSNDDHCDCSKLAVAATASPTNQRVAPEMLAILATSSPEIETLCQKSSVESFEDSCRHLSLMRQTSAPTILLDDLKLSTMSQTNAQPPPLPPTDIFVPRVSLSPPREGERLTVEIPSPQDRSSNRSPLDDITSSLAGIRLVTPTNMPPSASPVRRPSLHRRISHDKLPPPDQIANLGLPSTLAPLKATRSMSFSHVSATSSSLKGKRRHRRNTTTIMMSSRK